MRTLAKFVLVVLTLIFIGCEAEYIEPEDDGINIEQQGIDREEVERPGNQGGS